MKEEIVLAAKKVFNQKGLQNSTLRDIAREVPISDGHLRYYYKTKEDLILSCFTYMEQTITSFAAEERIGEPVGLSLIGALTKSFEVMYDFAFFFTASIDQLSLYPKVSAAYRQLIESRRILFQNLFVHFQATGIFIPAVDPVLFPVLYEQFFILSDNWVKYARMASNNEEKVNEKINHYVALCLGLLLPYFNSQLREEVLTWLKKTY